jgi:GTP-binding protein Era
MRFGTVAIIGKTNVGKSTFLNQALGQPLAIVSPAPETTRETLLGIAEHDGAQIAFLDTPGLHRPRTELGRRMNAAALEAARAADLVVFMLDISPLLRKRPATTPALDPEVASLLAALPSEVPRLVVVNKIDLLTDKQRLLPLLDALGKAGDFSAILPTSMNQQDGVERVLGEIVRQLPEGPPGYEPDQLTNRGADYFVREYVREQVLCTTSAEVPHAVAVQVDQISQDGKRVVARATIHVEKVGQRKILIGHGGAKIKEIGTQARKRLEELLGRKLHLELFVRVTPRWKNTPRQLAEIGYDAPDDPKLARAIADAKPQRRRAKRSSK